MPSDAVAEQLLDRIDGEQFTEWYDEREFERNLKEGRPYFNGPSRVPEPERHTPSKLLQCHRKIVYRQENAPAEQEPPEGIFWAGRRLEEDVVEPYLDDIVGDDEYVRNSMWIDTTIETDAGELRLKGMTDPVIVDAESEPLLVTEIKSKDDLDHVSGPNRHHRAQLHAYIHGLSAGYDREVTDGVVIYLSRTMLEMQAFHVPFDPDFWDDVVDWAAGHSAYRQAGDLPPADPEMSWECNFCEFKHRCGQSSEPYADVGVTGFLPGFDGYPRDRIVEYLKAHDDAKLTPTLATVHPDLVEQYGAYDWYCPTCCRRYGWGEVELNMKGGESPLCPNCAANSELSNLRTGFPSGQSV